MAKSSTQLKVVFLALDNKILKKIDIARSIFDKKGAELIKDQDLKILLTQYRDAIDVSSMVMKDFKLDIICKECALSVQGGGCCGKTIDEWYDYYLILINLLIGVTLPERRLDPEGCFFLGPEGCTLKARYHFCVNYLCYRITDRYKPEKIQRLTTQSGEELYLSWLIEIRLRELGI